MPAIPVDAARLHLIATGKVAALQEWKDGTRTGNQARDENTGMPLWNVDVLDLSDGNTRTTLMGVQLGSLDEPTLAALRPVTLTGLVLNFYVDRAGRLTMRWSAEHATGTPEETTNRTSTGRPSSVPNTGPTDKAA